MATRPDIGPLAGSIEHWNILLYADPGAGKTVFSGQDNKVLFIAPESDGLMSAQTMGSSAERIKVKDWETLTNAYEWFEENPEECGKYNVFAIDSISEMQYLAKDYVLRMTEDEKRRKGQDHTKMQLQDYGIMHELVENMVRNFNDLPVNVLWTATAKKVADADENEFLVPDLQGKKDYGIALKIAALMTSYGYMRVEVHEVDAPTAEDPKAKKSVKRRVIYWEDSGTIRGKDRSNALKPFTVNMTLQQMRLAIAGKMVRNSEGKIDKIGAAKATAPAKTTPPKIEAPQASPEATDKVESTTALPPNTHDPVTGEVALDAVTA
jgi:hypothetical protein